MKLEHVEIWVEDLEAMRAFYERYFGASAGPKYENQRKQFTSYFLTFPEGGRLELMHRPVAPPNPGSSEVRDHLGYARLGLEVESQAIVDALTARLQADGLRVLDGPRRTGDGYYESIVADPEGNQILICERRAV